MKVIFVTNYTELYGANKSLLEVITNMREKYSIEPVVITPGYGKFNKILDDLYIENFITSYYDWVYINKGPWIKFFIKRIRYNIFNYFALRKLVKKFKDTDVKLVHTNSSCSDVGCKLAKKINARHIWHIREFGLEDYNLLYYKGIRRACEFMEKNSNKVIVISKILKEKYDQFFTNKDKLTLIYNGVSEKNYLINRSKKIMETDFNIIFTGLICKEKNQIELIKAIDILVNKKSIKNIKVFFLGDGKEEYINELKKVCQESNIIDNVRFEGRVENVPEYIKNCRIGVISSYKEAFGRVTVEYMLGGLAVIASKSGANPEIIDDEENGLLYNLGNVEELSNKIELLYNNRDILRKISEGGQEKAQNRFTSDINCKNIYSLYNEELR